MNGFHCAARVRAGGGLVALLMAGLLAVAGCGTRRVTDTPRAASEQLIVAAAADRAVAQLDFVPLAGRRVYLDTTYFDSVDEGFVLSSIRNWASASGVLLMPNADEAEIIAEVRSGAVGVDRSEWLLGFPGINASGVPGANVPIVIPEAPLFKTTHQVGAARLTVFAYWKADRRFIYQSGPVFGFSDQRSWWLVGGGPFISGDVTPIEAGNVRDADLGTPPPRPGVGGPVPPATQEAAEPVPGTLPEAPAAPTPPMSPGPAGAPAEPATTAPEPSAAPASPSVPPATATEPAPEAPAEAPAPADVRLEGERPLPPLPGEQP